MSGVASIPSRPEQGAVLRAWSHLLAAAPGTSPAAGNRSTPSAAGSLAPSASSTGQTVFETPAGQVFLSHAATVDADLLKVVQQALQALEPHHAPSVIAPSRSQQLVDQVQGHLADQAQHVASHLERANRCWLLLTTNPVTTSGADSYNAPSAGARDRAERLLREIVETKSLPVALPGFNAATRAPRRTIFTGHRVPEGSDAEASTGWRLELADGGQGAAAAVVADQVEAAGGFLGRPGKPAEVVMDAELALAVRRDRLEMWLLVQLEVLAAHALAAEAAATRGDAVAQAGVDLPLVLGVQAYLLLPPQLTRAKHHHSATVGVRVVDERRDADGHRAAEHAAIGSTALALGAEAVTSEMLLISTGWLSEPAALVGFAHQMAVQLLEHFGLEATSVLTDEGQLDELAAAETDQQAIWQHAQALGLTCDPLSPAERRRRHEALVEQARAALRR